jgi:hypothetical protein
MQNLTTYLTGSVLLAVSTPVFSNDFEKNNLPCVAEFCLGDGLAELGKVNWDRARIPGVSFRGKSVYVTENPLPASDAKLVSELYPGKDSIAVAQYLKKRGFDGNALPLLQKVTAFCGSSSEPLKGTFTTKSGNPTEVGISLLPDPKDLKTQRWTIVSISRRYPEAKSPTQQADLRKQFDERYGRFGKLVPERGTPAVYVVSDPLSSSYGFDIFMRIDAYLGLEKKPRQSQPVNAACAGKPVSVD